MPEAPSLCLVFRADAGSTIGSGHVMRCLALAEENVRRGGRSVFITVCESVTLQDRLRDAGVEVLALDPTAGVEVMPGLIDGMLEGERRAAWVVLDGYAFDAHFQIAVAPPAVRRMVIVDSAVPIASQVAVFLNQNLGAADQEYPAGETAVALLGPRYALLRREIRDARTGGERQSPLRVLITMGGADAENASGRVLAALRALASDVDVRVLVGPLNPRAAALRELAPAVPGRLTVIEAAGGVAQHLAWADVAIAAAGATSYELASLGKAMILISTADNQVPVGRGLAHEGAALYLGCLDEVTDVMVVHALSQILNDEMLRTSLGERARRLVDGRGASRVLDVLEALGAPDVVDRLVIRPATAADALPLLRLANQPSVRSRSFSPAPIPLDEHRRWLEGRLAAQDVRILVAELGDVVVAQIRYELKRDGIEVSFAVGAAFRGRGVGTMLLERTGVDAARALGTSRIYGLVMTDNPASLRTFEKAGYVLAGRAERGGRECFVVERVVAVAEDAN